MTNFFCGRTAALCSSGSLSAAASRRRISRDSDRRQEAGEFDVSTRTCCRRIPQPAREVTRAGSPRDRGREGAFFFGYFLLGKQKKVTGDQGGSTKRTRT